MLHLPNIDLAYYSITQYAVIFVGVPPIKSEYPSLTAISTPSVMTLDTAVIEAAKRAYSNPDATTQQFEVIQLPARSVLRSTSPVRVRSRSVSPAYRSVSPAPSCISPVPHAVSPAPLGTDSTHQPIQCYTTVMKNTAKGAYIASRFIHVP